MDKAISAILLCYTGASSSYFVVALKEEAEKRNINLTVESHTVSPFPTNFSKYDLILVAPQVKHCMKQLEETVGNSKIPIIPIDFQTFGLHETGKVLNQIMGIVSQKS